MKKIMSVFIILIITLCLYGCETVQMNVSVQGETNEFSNIENGFIKICDKPIALVYDEMTRIIYINNYAYNANHIRTPYYAPNGLPYKFNTETNTFEEIQK